MTAKVDAGYYSHWSPIQNWPLSSVFSAKFIGKCKENEIFQTKVACAIESKGAGNLEKGNFHG